jgi:hypothetical protein
MGWHDPTFSLAVMSRAYVKNLRITWSPTTAPLYFGDLPLIQGYWHSTNVPDEPIIPINTLTDGIGEIEQDYYIGEAINELGNVTVPPLAKITCVPFAGQTIEKTTTVYQNRNIKTIMGTFRWKYKTVNHYDNWGVFPDVWRTGLREYRSDNGSGVLDSVYNYAFMRGVGLVDFWYGQFQPNGTILGYEFYAYSY